MANGLLIDPAGQSVTVTITAASSGALLTLFSDSNATTPRANSFTITTPTKVWVKETVQALVSLKVAGAEVATSSGSPASFTFEDGAVGTLSTFGGGSLPAVAQQATTDSATYQVSAKAGAVLPLTGGGETRLDPDLATAIRATSPLSITTGFAGNDIVEPAIRYFPNGCPVGMDGKKYVLAACPYPNADATKENPSLWVSDDGTTWTVPTGVTNPVYGNAVGGGGYGNNSDVDIILGVDNVWYMIWNQFGPAGTWKIRGGSSTDGVTWTAPVDLVSTVLATSRPTCPTILYDPKLSLYVMYALEKDVTAGQPLTLMRYTASNPLGPWTLGAAPTLTWPQSGRGPWHLNAYLVGEQHVLLIDDTVIDGSGPGYLYLATSDDHGATWTVGKRPAMVARAKAGAWDTGGLYRSALVPRQRGDQLAFDLFYGAIDDSGTPVWKLGRSTLTFDRQRHGNAATAKTATGLSVYYASPGTGVGTAVFTNGDVRSTPIYFDRTVTLDRIGVEVTAFNDVAAYYRLGIYADNGDGMPGLLILDAGPTAAMSANGWYEVTINQTLPPGMYWLVGVAQNVTGTAPTMRSNTAGAGTPSVGSTTALTVSQNAALGWRSATTMTGALGGAFGSYPPNMSATAPRVCVRVS